MAAAMPGIRVASAGLQPLSGQQADPFALELMNERGIDIGAHRAQAMNMDMCQRADLILVMDREQRRSVQERYLFAAGKVFRLCESSGLDVPDPYRADRGAFQRSLALIEDGAQQWVNRISRVSS